MRFSPGSSGRASLGASGGPARAAGVSVAGWSWARWTALSILLLAVAIPRFDLWDPGPIGRFTAGAKANAWGRPIDVEGYARLVAWFRGAAPADSMIAPFCFRPLAPAIAAAIPGPPTRSLNVLNLAALLATLALLEAIGATLRFGARGRWAMGLLFAVSFPTFYYGAIGFVDPVAIACATLVLLLTLRGAPSPALVAACVLATLAKETNAAFALLGLAWAWSDGSESAASGDRIHAIGRAAVPFLAATITFAALRALMPFPERAHFWAPSAAAAVENLARARTYASLFLTIGSVAGFAAAAVASRRVAGHFDARGRAILLDGTLLAFGLYAYSMLSAYTDGRIVWAAYPFLLPVAAAWFDSAPREGGSMPVGRRE
jgi:hypothetical protein